MKKYIIESIEKFTKDALSKVIYDVLKWLIPTFIIFAITHWLPKDLSFSKLIFKTFAVSAYTIILYSIGIIIISTFMLRIFLIKKYKALEIDNFTDELTGLKNHKALKVYLNEKMIEFKGKTEALSLIIIDIDNFKYFNTTYNYNTADNILKKVGELLSNDKRATDETFRQFFRGDEFIVVTTETSLNEALLAAERKRKLIEKSLFSIDDKTFSLTVSCGVTELKKDSDDFVSITDRLTKALNQSKSTEGKNCSNAIV